MSPEQTLRQRQAALDSANRIRTAMADFKRDCRAARTEEACAIVADLLRNPGAGRELEAMKIRHVLQCIPRIGGVKTTGLLLDVDIYNSDRPLRAVSARQRAKLAEM